LILSKIGIGVGARLIERWAARRARDAKNRNKGREDVFKLWRSGMTYEQARRKLGQ
jgi:hypothetical protein